MPPTHEHHDQAETEDLDEIKASIAEAERTWDGSKEHDLGVLAWVAQSKALVAEVERLQRLVEKRVTKAEEIQRRHDAVASLADEISRLRAALREVVAQGHLDACKISVGRCNCAYSDAVEALDPPGPTRPEHSHG